jgi:hypothetical protein
MPHQSDSMQAQERMNLSVTGPAQPESHEGLSAWLSSSAPSLPSFVPLWTAQQAQGQLQQQETQQQVSGWFCSLKSAIKGVSFHAKSSLTSQPTGTHFQQLRPVRLLTNTDNVQDFPFTAHPMER